MTALIRCRPHGKGILDRNKGGLVLWMNDQMKSSSVWSDMSGRGNHGTVYGAGTPPPATPGALGYTFDGVDDYVDVGNATSLKQQNFSVGFWYTAKEYDTGGFMGDAVSSNNAWFLYSNTQAQGIVLAKGNGTAMQYIVLGIENQPTNTWLYFSLTKNGMEIKTYIDGVLKSTNTLTDATISYTTNPFYLGKVTPTNWHNGSIDEVRIYNRALSASEISRLFQSTRGKFGV